MCRSNVQEPMYVFQLASPMLCCCSVQEQEKEEEDSHTGHAVLHDFCMMIPYGALALIVSIALWASGAPFRCVCVCVCVRVCV